MASSPILDECRALLEDLGRVERQLSMLAGDMVDSVADQSEDELSRIEGLLDSQAKAEEQLGRNQEAKDLWKRSLAIVEKAFGPEHPKVALRLGNLADLIQESGEAEEAEEYYQRLLSMREAGTGRRRREIKSSLRKYAKLLRSTRRKREAVKVEAEIKTSPAGWFPKWR